MKTTHSRTLAVLMTTAMTMTACMTPNQWVYDSSQNWQKQQCLKIQDRDERQRCEKSAATSYDKYVAEREAARGNLPSKAP